MTDTPMSVDERFWDALDKLSGDAALVIDRPRGSPHPRYPQIICPLDYGYLDGTTAADGGGIDVWRGSEPGPRVAAIIVTIDPVKRDSEIKVLLGCNGADIETALAFHNRTGSMKGMLVRRAMVGDEGLEPPTSSV